MPTGASRSTTSSSKPTDKRSSRRSSSSHPCGAPDVYVCDRQHDRHLSLNYPASASDHRRPAGVRLRRVPGDPVRLAHAADAGHHQVPRPRPTRRRVRRRHRARARRRHTGDRRTRLDQRHPDHPVAADVSAEWAKRWLSDLSDHGSGRLMPSTLLPGGLEGNTYDELASGNYSDLATHNYAGPAIIRQVSLSVTFAGVALSDVIQARGEVSADS